MHATSLSHQVPETIILSHHTVINSMSQPGTDTSCCFLIWFPFWSICLGRSPLCHLSLICTSCLPCSNNPSIPAWGCPAGQSRWLQGNSRRGLMFQQELMSKEKFHKLPSFFLMLCRRRRSDALGIGNTPTWGPLLCVYLPFLSNTSWGGKETIWWHHSRGLRDGGSSQARKCSLFHMQGSVGETRVQEKNTSRLQEVCVQLWNSCM